VQEASAADNSASDDLPAAAPLAGPVPLPRRRPNVIAMAEPAGGVPLPRARPADAPAATPAATVSDAPSGYAPGLDGH
jgi:hypothetical protein